MKLFLSTSVRLVSRSAMPAVGHILLVCRASRLTVNRGTVYFRAWTERTSPFESFFFVVFTSTSFSQMVVSLRAHPQRPTAGSLPSSQRPAQGNTSHVHSTSILSPESSTMSSLAPTSLSSTRKLSSLGRRMPPTTVSFVIMCIFTFSISSFVRCSRTLHCGQGAD